jgi:hypothetical protein
MRLRYLLPLVFASAAFWSCRSQGNDSAVPPIAGETPTAGDAGGTGAEGAVEQPIAEQTDGAVAEQADGAVAVVTDESTEAAGGAEAAQALDEEAARAAALQAQVDAAHAAAEQAAREQAAREQAAANRPPRARGRFPSKRRRSNSARNT